ncbi:hypothetical protein BOTNAR_2195g00010 [Botryotinia narcissicola]|uniref:Uncharacterized protein n=1 Tax=Botryotinia narcissicola TaxID=278944 RepID=A0A4Z1H646_9HELO|nr:hypothetical protein BOTNAR_2195g00010 [Botryotinia narcissicola]
MEPDASNCVFITNSKFDGTILWFAKCNNHYYWILSKIGGLHLSVESNIFFQTVNNYWLDIQRTRRSVFQIGEGVKSSRNRDAGCASIISRKCQAKNLAASGSFAGTNTDVLTVAKSLAGSLAAVADVSTTKANVLKNAGIGKIKMMS